MRHLAIALLLIGCGSSNKQPAGPGTGTGAGTDNGTGTGAGTGADTAMKPGGDADASAGKREAPPPPPDTGGYKLVAPASLKWQPLDPNNPGPELALVSGDLQNGGGFFLKLPPGTKPGLHTHTSDYHAVVISGAPKHWLPGEDKKAKPLAAGSYWFQPGNQPHGDECTGTEPCVLYLVMSGAFDFTATPKAKPVKPGSYSLVDRKTLKWSPMDPKQPQGAKVAIVSGDPKTGPVAFIVEVPPGVNSGLHGHTSDYHALVLEGAPAHWLPHEANEGESLAPGTYWFQPGGYDHGDRCTGTVTCRTFVMMPKAMDFTPPKKK